MQLHQEGPTSDVLVLLFQSTSYPSGRHVLPVSKVAKWPSSLFHALPRPETPRLKLSPQNDTALLIPITEPVSGRHTVTNGVVVMNKFT